MIISLIGFMGCGKSSVGKRLSELLCCSFVDLDAVIEENAGRGIPEIFASDGEAVFRQMECDALRNILEKAEKPLSNHKHTQILALGGGTVTTTGCAELIREKTRCIYLRASVETLLSHLSDEAAGRPLLSSCHVKRAQGDEISASELRTKIETLMAQRSTIYESTAHHIIDTDGLTIDTVAQSILHTLCN